MQIEVLQEFLTVANVLNFRRAAEQLHITQPALSKHIAALEREIGFTLFDRVGVTRLTAEGRRFYVYAQRVLDTLEEGVAECRAMSSKGTAVRVQWSEQESEMFERMLLKLKTPHAIVHPRQSSTIFEALTGDYADVVVTYDIDVHAPLSLEIEHNLIERVRIGQDRLAILASPQILDAPEGGPTTEELCDVEIMIPYGSVFEHVETSVRTLLGNAPGLRFVQNPSLTDTRDVPYCDFTESVLFGLYGRVHAAQRKRPDLVAYDTIDGRPIVAHVYLAFLRDNPNPNVRVLVNEALSLAKAADAS